jgi:protein TonB
MASSGPLAGASGDSSGGGQPAGTRLGGGGGVPSPDGAGPGDRSGSVSLEDQSWSCPWPRGADADQIDEQTVVIRVVVDADGRVESARVLSDPGHGFGEAAVACALRSRFNPARDRAGRPTRSSSPPILVRFTR